MTRRPAPTKYECPMCGNTITMRIAHATPRCSKNGVHKTVDMRKVEAG